MKRALRLVGIVLALLAAFAVTAAGGEIEEFRKRAERGDAKAQYTLGVAYGSGEGVAQNDAEAVKWWRKAAEQGHAMAQYKLGVAYESGEGVVQNDAEAVKWWRKAAEQGCVQAQRGLGVMYGAGIGVPRDSVKAYMWADLAATKTGGLERNGALAVRDVIAAKMTPAQIAEAQNLAREWQEQFEKRREGK